MAADEKKVPEGQVAVPVAFAPEEEEIAPEPEGEPPAAEEPATEPEDEPGQEAAEEPPAEEPKKEEPPAETPPADELDDPRIDKYFVRDGKLDKRKLGQLLDEGADARKHLAALVERAKSDPKFRAALIETGFLEAPAEAAAEPERAPAQVRSDEDVEREATALFKEGKAAQAAKVVAEHERKKAESAVETRLARIQAENQKRTEAETNRRTGEMVAAEARQVAEMYPDVVQVNARGELVIKDPEVRALAIELATGADGSTTSILAKPGGLKRVMELALKGTGKLVRKPAPKPTPATRAAAPAAPPLASAPKPKDGQIAVPVRVTSGRGR